jgi:adenylate cyclase
VASLSPACARLRPRPTAWEKGLGTLRSVAGDRVSLSEAAERVGVSPATLRRWADTGVIPEGREDGSLTPAAVAHARIAARLRERGHSLDQIRSASAEGRLAYGYVEDLFPPSPADRDLSEVAEATGLEESLIERVWTSIGFPASDLERLSDDDVQALRYISSVLAAGFPLVAFLQLTRVYGQAIARIAETETRLFHIYVHEPLMRQEVPELEMAEEMEHLARDLLPLASPIMDFVHQRYLQHFVEQDMVGHMEMEVDSDDALGRLRVAIAFGDLAGYTRYTEEEGEEQALSYVERFIDAVAETLPDDARIVKSIGDEVMIIGSEATTLTEWAVGFQRLFDDRPPARIGVHTGAAIYRDGDYFGRDVNLASRIVARSAGGEVLVTEAVVEAAGGSDHLEFEPVGQVKLKGFDEPQRLCRANLR